MARAKQGERLGGDGPIRVVGDLPVDLEQANDLLPVRVEFDGSGVELDLVEAQAFFLSRLNEVARKDAADLGRSRLIETDGARLSQSTCPRIPFAR